MVGQARGLLATRLGVAAEQIALSTVEPVQWPNAGLGCPKPNVDYIPIPTPGFRILLEVSGATYEYHADKDGRVIPCGMGQT